MGAINPEYRDSLTALRNAYLFFLRDKDHEMALNEMNKVKHHNELKIKRDIKHLSILIHYEKGNFEYARDLVESFIKYLNKKATPQIEKQLFSEFLRLLKFLLEHNSDKDKKTLEYLKIEVENFGPLPSKLWLLEKIDEAIINKV